MSEWVNPEAASRVFIVGYKHGQEAIRLHELSQEPIRLHNLSQVFKNQHEPTTRGVVIVSRNLERTN